jgi:hypothetical protein
MNTRVCFCSGTRSRLDCYCAHERLLSGARQAITKTLCGLSEKPGASRWACRSSRTSRILLHRPLPPGERKSVEPMAARLAPHDVRRVHRSLHHFVRDEALLERVRHSVLPVMKRNGLAGGLDRGRHGSPRKESIPLGWCVSTALAG